MVLPPVLVAPIGTTMRGTLIGTSAVGSPVTSF